MARQVTCDAVVKIRQLLGGDIPATTRLSQLDYDLWRLGLLIRDSPKMQVEVIKKKRIFGFCKSTGSELTIEVDTKVFGKIIDMYEEEYTKQLAICQGLIEKLER